MSRRPTVSGRRCSRAEVHRSTAARALNPASSGMLSLETVSRVQRAARELGYTTNTFAPRAAHLPVAHHRGSSSPT